MPAITARVVATALLQIGRCVVLLPVVSVGFFLFRWFFFVQFWLKRIGLVNRVEGAQNYLKIAKERLNCVVWTFAIPKQKANAPARNVTGFNAIKRHHMWRAAEPEGSTTSRKGYVVQQAVKAGDVWEKIEVTPKYDVHAAMAEAADAHDDLTPPKKLKTTSGRRIAKLKKLRDMSTAFVDHDFSAGETGPRITVQYDVAGGKGTDKFNGTIIATRQRRVMLVSAADEDEFEASDKAKLLETADNNPIIDDQRLQQLSEGVDIHSKSFHALFDVLVRFDADDGGVETFDWVELTKRVCAVE